MQHIDTDVCIVGGGPAGMMLALLLAKQHIKVVVLERNDNFDREYRGEVLLPRFVQMIEQLNLKSYIESHPHIKLNHIELMQGIKKLAGFRFSDMDPKFSYAMWMPQTILLQALHEKCKLYPNFSLLFHASVKQVIKDVERVTGVIATRGEEEDIRISAKITVGADGRFSTVRKLANFETEYDIHKNDIVWFTIPHPPGMESALRFNLSSTLHLVLPKYPNLLQIGLVFQKNVWKQIRERGIESFRETLRGLNPLFYQFADELHDFRPFFVLQSRIMNVKEWAQDGCVLIGDAAHCASPVGAIGVSLSTATAIVAADVIWRALLKGDMTKGFLRRIQTVRQKEIRMVHRSQMRVEQIVSKNSRLFVFMGTKVVPIFSKTPLVKYFQRKAFLLPAPLPIDPSFRFS